MGLFRLNLRLELQELTANAVPRRFRPVSKIVVTLVGLIKLANEFITNNFAIACLIREYGIETRVLR